MALDQLDTPLRISWDFHGNGEPMPVELVDCVVERLLEAGVFFVTLEREPLRHSQIAKVLERLLAGGCQSLVVCSGRSEELAVLGSALPLRRLFLDISRWIESGALLRKPLAAVVEEVRSKGLEPDFYLVPNTGNILLIPELFALCQALGIGRIKLPNSPYDGSLAGTEAGLLPGPDDLDRLADLLQQAPLNSSTGVTLDIHDLFLWELLQPSLGGERGEYGGCQAGNSLGHIDFRGQLHPCSSWPQPLGLLTQQSIETLWDSALRHQIRAEIAASPKGCLGCGDYPICFGGCRGLARSLNKQAGERDLLCRGPRPHRS